MNHRVLFAVLVGFLVIGLTACISDYSIQKRKHRPGWHVQKHGKMKPVEPLQIAPENENEGGNSVVEVSSPVSSDEVAELHEHPAVEAEKKSHLEVTTLSDEEVFTNPYQEGFTPTEFYFQALETPAESTSKVEDESSNAAHNVLLMLLASGLLGGVLLAGGSSYARKVSTWARSNPIKTRGILSITHLSLGFGAFYAGYALGELGHSVSESVTHAMLAGIALAVVSYPLTARFTPNRKADFLRRKTIEMGTMLGGISLVFALASQFPAMAEAPNVLAEMLTPILLPSHEWGAIQNPEMVDVPTTGFYVGNILLSLVVIAVAAAILLVSILFGCSLSCGGNQLAGGIVMISGLVLSLTLLIWLMIIIWAPERKQKYIAKRQPTG